MTDIIIWIWIILGFIAYLYVFEKDIRENKIKNYLIVEFIILSVGIICFGLFSFIEAIRDILKH